MALSQSVVDELLDAMPCGPDVNLIVDAARDALGAGVDHRYFHQIGDDQEGFCMLWADELRPALKDVVATGRT